MAVARGVQAWDSMPRAVLWSLALALLLVGGCSASDDGGEISGPDASTAPAADAGDGPLPFMSPCDLDNDQCDAEAGDMCFSFNMKGPHCTRACETAAECPEPSPGCNNKGVCKAP